MHVGPSKKANIIDTVLSVSLADKFKEVKLALLINSWNYVRSPPIACRLIHAQPKGDNYAIRAVVVRGDFA
jgi:hypothetical protein